MKAERLILTSMIKGRTQVRLWDSTQPISIGHPVRWILERSPNGVRVRHLHGSGQALHVEESVLDGKTLIQLPDSQIRIRLNRLRPIRAAYLDANSTSRSDEMPVLMAFSGVRRSVMSSLEVHTAYVAYCKGKPAFTIQNDETGIRLNLLSNKLKLKRKGQPSIPGFPGETWKLTRDELPSVTITRDWYWWRFNLVSQAAGVPAPIEGEKDRFFFKAMIAILLAVFLALGVGKLLHKEPPVEKEIPIEIPKKQKIIIRRNDIAAPQPAPVAAAAPAPVTAPVKQLAPPAEKVTKALPGPKTVQKAAGGQAKTHVKVTDMASRLARSQTKILKDALGGAASMMKNLVTPGSSAKSFSGIFANSGPVVSQTEVKPGFSGTNVNVGKIGGNGSGGAGGGSSTSVGYGSGEHGSVSGQGTSLVADGIGGSMVDEGLTKEQVGAVIHAHMNEIRYCHEVAMLASPGIQGKLVVGFSIDPSGKVENSSVQSSTLLPDTSIQTCLLRRLAGWHFPKPRGGVHVNVSYPFLFKTLSRE